jgi:hypothetical protein
MGKNRTAWPVFVTQIVGLVTAIVTLATALLKR